MQDNFKDWGWWWETFERFDSYKMCYSLVRLKANKSQPSVDRVSAECRQSIDRLVVVLRRLLTDTWVRRHLTDCLPTVHWYLNRVSVESGSTVNPDINWVLMEMSIDTQPRMPLVHMIQFHWSTQIEIIQKPILLKDSYLRNSAIDYKI